MILRIRCLFVEKDNEAFLRLQEHVHQINDIDIKLIKGNFESEIPEVLQFATSDNNMFTFTFIDPTGWTGFSLNNIGPLLNLQFSEVLINFMTKDIIRFIGDNRPEIRKTFIELFGTDEVQEQWKHLEGRERENAIVEAYKERIRKEGNFDFVADALVLNPLKDRTHFNLIYGTRKLDGLLAFREVERKAMEEQEKIRDNAQLNKRFEKTNQYEFKFPDPIKSNYFEELRCEYLQKSKDSIIKLIKDLKCVKYDLLLSFLEKPMIYEKDIKYWIKRWQDKGLIEIQGLAPRERVPKMRKNHTIIWKEV